MSKNIDEPTIELSDVSTADVPEGVDRRAFMMRSALVGAVAVITGCAPSNRETAAASAPAPAAPPPPQQPALSADLDVVKKAKGD